jgi:hypothetical protein
MVESVREGPCIWNDDEDMVTRRRRRSGHQIMVEQPDYFSRAAEQGVRLELRIMPCSHLFA